ncbi:MAG: 3-phosphoshikimate 1-carboxyvinyltransferase [Clostridia bacterium]|nr:3-phosphoshikimate 1-carboxyvinyltransferase [Clostridia bacterium]
MAVTCVNPGKWQGTLTVPPSKSIAHRALILSALTGGGQVTPIIPSQDMLATQACLHFDGEYPCRESGSTLRFMIPLALLKTGGGHFTGAGRLGQRPLTPYENCLNASFTYVQGDGLDLTVKGQLKAGVYTLPGNVSSQFITGLLLALPFVRGDSEIHITPPLESKGYIDLTLQAMADFGLVVHRPDELTFLIPGGQKGQSRDYQVEGDYSQAAVPLCAAALGNPVTVKGLRRDSRQGDAQILPWLQMMGAQVQWQGDEVTVTAPKGLHGIAIDGSQCPDIIPILALTCALATGESRLKNLSRLRIKESDRLAAACEVINLLGGSAQIENEGLVIQGQPSLKGGVTALDYNDHRMVMMLAAAATRCEEPVTIQGSQAISKSWPSFWEDVAFLK